MLKINLEFKNIIIHSIPSLGNIEPVELQPGEQPLVLPHHVVREVLELQETPIALRTLDTEQKESY